MAPKTVVVGGGASKSATRALREVLVDVLRHWRRPESDGNSNGNSLVIVTFHRLYCVAAESTFRILSDPLGCTEPGLM